jgi:hypothetical protein
VKKFKFVSDKDIVGHIMSLSAFKRALESGCIIHYDGIVGCILVDKKPTNIALKDWRWKFLDEEVEMTFEELEKIDGEVEVEWCNR